MKTASKSTWAKQSKSTVWDKSKLSNSSEIDSSKSSREKSSSMPEVAQDTDDSVGQEQAPIKGTSSTYPGGTGKEEGLLTKTGKGKLNLKSKGEVRRGRRKGENNIQVTNENTLCPPLITDCATDESEEGARGSKNKRRARKRRRAKKKKLGLRKEILHRCEQLRLERDALLSPMNRFRNDAAISGGGKNDSAGKNDTDKHLLLTEALLLNGSGITALQLQNLRADAVNDCNGSNKVNRAKRKKPETMKQRRGSDNFQATLDVAKNAGLDVAKCRSPQKSQATSPNRDYRHQIRVHPSQLCTEQSHPHRGYIENLCSDHVVQSQSNIVLAYPSQVYSQQVYDNTRTDFHHTHAQTETVAYATGYGSSNCNIGYGVTYPYMMVVAPQYLPANKSTNTQLSGDEMVHMNDSGYQTESSWSVQRPILSMVQGLDSKAKEKSVSDSKAAYTNVENTAWSQY